MYALPKDWLNTLDSTDSMQVDGRSRVSNVWIPTGGISKKPVDGEKGTPFRTPIGIDYH